MNNSDYLSSTIAKCGSLQRQTSLLRRWKPCWLVLYQSGRLSIYENQHSTVAVDTVNIPYDFFTLQNSDQVRASAPSGKSSNCLFGYKTSGKTHYFCADDPDDKEAWLVAIKEVRNIQPSLYTACPRPYGMFTGGTYETVCQPAYVLPVQMPVVYYPPVVYRRRLMGTNLAVGLLAGTAAASMLALWPWMLWW
ncbi:hypothetical protein M514_01188 [Trichuris suis]|uniref:PH domain-containing protein n=1 Tax=Trichuris suis TaxID=68888 RepID=A0A085NN17_9BILA|nr:hypothetical protein M513_01188 [Trichuris suis]KFD70863.1 hypothetical protein M514_01188 [Trichuris suis]